MESPPIGSLNQGKWNGNATLRSVVVVVVVIHLIRPRRSDNVNIIDIPSTEQGGRE